MYERNKIAEAEYFLSQMRKNRDDRESFTYNLSAFLSSSRSVLQYALEEAKTKSNGQKWFDDYVFKTHIFNFFKDKRDINIHFEPIDPTKHVDVTLKGTLHLSGALSIIVRNAKGVIKQQYKSEESEQSQAATETPTVIEFRYLFDDWSGNEDIETLSELYLQELKKFVKDGLMKKKITG